MTNEQLDEIEKLAEAADQGEWNAFPPFGSGWGIASKTPHPMAPHADMPIAEAGQKEVDAANVKAIVALHNAALPMIKALREAREVLGLILSTDALPHWAFDAGDDDESLYDMVRRAAGKDAL